MHTKKQRAQQIFDMMHSPDERNRQHIIEEFIKVLHMTKAGANTYYANCKKASSTNQVSAFQSTVKSMVAPSGSVLTDQPQWKKDVLEKHDRICRLAEQLYDVDLSKLEVRFDLKGRAAGQACRRGQQYIIRYNVEAIKKYPQEMDETIPHEIAHIVCFINPKLGRNHDWGWKSVCQRLGGDGSRCHSMTLTPAKKRVKYLYVVDGVHVEIGPKVHKKIQMIGAKYKLNATGKPILRTHYVKQVDS